jgi:LysM repeat protein
MIGPRPGASRTKSLLARVGRTAILLASISSTTACAQILDRASPVGDGAASPSPAALQGHSVLGPESAPKPEALPSTTTLTGRLVDATTGLPIPDAGVALLGVDRRTITMPDGGFRFDGAPAGALTLVLGPAEGYVARGWDVSAAAGAADVGLVTLLPAAASTLIEPEYGGVVPGCLGTDLTLATDALAASQAVRVTCLERERQLPAPAPAGRLPLFAVDLAPSAVLTKGVARLRVALPPQPRYAAGVPLDLLRLDLDRLLWVKSGSLVVDPGGDTASGAVSAFGTYLVASPPYGTFAVDTKAPIVTEFRLSLAADGPPTSVVAAGTTSLYAVFEYAGFTETPVAVRTSSADGQTVFEGHGTYSGQGRAVFEMSHQGGWPLGDYLTTIWVGTAPSPVHQVPWAVTDRPLQPEPTPTVPAAPQVGLPSNSVGWPEWPSAGSCQPPAGWYAYVVQAGDTLAGLAARTGTSVAELASANCMVGTDLYAGQVLYIPRPPSRQPAPQAPAWPTMPPRSAGEWPAPATAVPRPTEPEWPTYAPPAPWPTGRPGWPQPTQPAPPPATAAPRPTEPELPTVEPPVEPPAETSAGPPVGPPVEPPTMAPSEPEVTAPVPGEPTAKWPTVPPEASTP